MGSPSFFSQRCTVRTSRRRYEAISFQESSRSAGLPPAIQGSFFMECDNLRHFPRAAACRLRANSNERYSPNRREKEGQYEKPVADGGPAVRERCSLPGRAWSRRAAARRRSAAANCLRDGPGYAVQRSFHVDHTRRHPGDDGPEEPAAHHVGNGGLRDLSGDALPRNRRQSGSGSGAYLRRRRRPGHFHRTSEFRFRFTNFVFASNYVAPIQGVLQSIPGATNLRAHDKEGTLQTVDQIEKVVTPTAASAVGGAIIGAEHGFGIGKFTGGGLGSALGLGAVLLRRGDKISLRQGTYVEMILQAPLILEQSQVAENARYKPVPSVFPAAQSEEEVRGHRHRQRMHRLGLAEGIFAAYWAR